jgi:hypothetical protein
LNVILHMMLRERGLSLARRLVLLSCVLGALTTPGVSLPSSCMGNSQAAFPPVRDRLGGLHRDSAASYNSIAPISPAENVPTVADNAVNYIPADYPLDDTVPPVISLYGYSTMTIQVGTTYWEPGYTAYDDQDGSLTWYVTVTGWVNSSVLGTYTLRYNVRDFSGNAAEEKTRTVYVVDTTAPRITLLGDNPFELQVGTTYYEPGYRATDNYDGDLTWQVTVTGYVRSYDLGTYTLRYNVRDSSGNPADEKVRTVEVVDTVRPVIQLLGDDPVILEVGTWYTDPGYTATDNYDGDITSRVWVRGCVDHNYLGDYTLTYTVSDSSGNAAEEKKRTVRVVDMTRPAIRLLGDDVVVLEAGTWYTDPGYTATDNYDGDITSRVWVRGSVDHNYLGDYSLTYTVSDSSGNPAEEKKRTVRVVDTTPPVITLRGGNTVTLKVGTPFTEPGFTASDNYDGDITANVRVSGSVDSMWPGSYVLRYTVSDSSGNPAEGKVRTVNVVDWELSLQVAQVSDVQTGQIAVSYIVGHSQGRPCTALIEFTPDSGASWWPACHGFGGDGLMNLSSSPAGEAHTFMWDSVADLGGATREEPVQVRITVFDGDFSSSPATTGHFSLDNSLADADNDNLPDTWERQIADFDGSDDIVFPADVSPDADFDGDGKTNWQEYLAGTDPTDAASAFSARLARGSYALSWPSVQGKFYIVYFCEQLGEEWTPITEEMPGEMSGQLPLDDAAMAGRLGFFKVAVY